MDRLLVLVAVALVLVFGASKAWGEPAAGQDASTTTTTEATTTTVDPSAPPDGEPVDPSRQSDEESGGDTGHGFFDFVGRARDAINGWFSHLAAAALNPTLDLLGRTVFSTPNFTGPGRVRDLWLVSWAIADSVFVLFVVGAGVLAMSRETLQTRFALKDLLPRLAVAFITANASLFVSGFAINLANALSRAFTSQGVGEARGAAGVVLVLVEAAIDGGSIFLRLLGLAVAVLALGVLGTWLGRLATMVVLVGAAPLFLIGHALPATDGMARLWWRALLGCLAVQVGQAFVLVTATRVLLDADGRRTAGIPGGALMDLLVVGALLWLMLRIPSYARRLVLTPGGTGGQVIRYAAAGRATRALRAAV